jgi:hypothetical protein
MKIFRKLIALVLVLMMVLSFAGCHKKNEIAVTIGDVEFTSAYYMCAFVNAYMEAQQLVYNELTEEEMALIRKNGLVWGCDRCQEVCPHNKDAKIDPHPCFDSFTPHFIENDPDFNKRAYAWRGEAVIRRNIEILK